MILTRSRVDSIFERTGFASSNSIYVLVEVNGSYYPIQTTARSRYSSVSNRYSLTMNIPGYPEIAIEQISEYFFVAKKTREEMRPWYAQKTLYKAYRPSKSNFIIEEKDLDDFYLVTIAEAPRDKGIRIGNDLILPATVKIYHNFQVALTLNNVVTPFVMGVDDYNCDYNDFSFNRVIDLATGEIQRFHWDGTKEAIDDSLRIKDSTSFSEWCKITGHYFLLSLYSSENSIAVDSPELLWSSGYIVKWTCRHGHTWKAKISDYTKNPPDRFNACQECERIKKNGDPSLIEKQVFDVVKHIDDDQLFIDGYGDYPHTISFTFKHPCNKYSEVAMFLARTEGVLTQESFDTYTLTYSPKEIDKILRMYFCMDSLNYNEHAKRTKTPCDDICDLTEAKEYLKKYHRCFVLIKLLDQLSIYPSSDERKLDLKAIGTHCHKILDNERGKIRKIYDNMILSGEKVGVWKSEQKMFALVSSVFHDAIFQYRANWLGAQSLDVFVPSRNLGFEYQGEQHYEPIEFFGGEETFQGRVELDERKRKLCSENGVRLIEWKWNEDISTQILQEKLQKLGINI